MGSFFEEIQWFIKEAVWTCRCDLLYGHFSTLYGFGVVLILLFLIPKNDQRGFIKTFFYSFLLGGIFEYLAGLFSWEVLHIKFWDYSTMFLNIGGKTTIPIMVVWGVMGLVLVKFVYPLLSAWIEKIPYKLGNFICILFLLFLSFDMILSYSVFARMLLRHQGIAPVSFVGRFYDKVYNDEVIYNKYPILQGK